MTGKTPFSSTDVYLAAALAAIGLQYDRLENHDRRVTFFWDDPCAETKAREYYSHQLEIKAVDYAAAIRLIKTLLHSPLALG